MPRIRQNAQKYAEEDFLEEVQIRMIKSNVDSWRELSERIGICPASMCKRKKDVGGFSVRELQGIVRAVRPDPVIILKLLGYQGKDIPKNIMEEVDCA